MADPIRETTRFEVIRRPDGFLVGIEGSATHCRFVRTEQELGAAVVSLLRLVTR